jgi:dTDP-3-amino-3,4,6-trideoxy-alpha-D-glucose transaminase
VSPLSRRTGLDVPFFDLAPSHAPLVGDILDAVSDLLGSNAFTNGPQVASFEEAFARYCGTAHCVGTASGLDALRLALQALGLEPGDEVLVPAMTFVATFEAVTQAGGVPVPVDVSPADYCIDVAEIDAAIGPRTRVVMPVDLYGRVAEIDAIRTLAAARDLLLVEDACQAHGASRNGVRAGKGGTAAAFSFYPAKNLGAIGDAGALVTDDAELAGRVRALREHGQKRKYEHEFVGWTSRLDTIQAAVLLRKLPHLDEWNGQRRAIADLYAQGLEGVGDLVLPDTSDRGQVWHLFVVLTDNPSGLAAHLTERSIGTGRHYPEPPHLSDAYAHLGLAAGSFPVAEEVARRGLSLPIFPGMSIEQAEHVTENVRSWFARG